MHRRLSGRSAASTHLRNSQGRGHGSNRSREGPHPPSPRRWPAERRRRRAGPSRLARSKGPPAHRDDHRRKQKGNFARPRSRPHVVTPADPGSGIRLPTTTDLADNKAALAQPAAARTPKEKPRRGRGSSTGTNELRGSSSLFHRVNAQPRARFRLSIKNFFGRPPSGRETAPDPRSWRWMTAPDPARSRPQHAHRLQKSRRMALSGIGNRGPHPTLRVADDVGLCISSDVRQRPRISISVGEALGGSPK